ncbi:MAG: aspartate aminotransferase family protein [Armatimonadetes bacterium]|nr:aspartate aminotransferase family protein [Armatimonadota bacterium]
MQHERLIASDANEDIVALEQRYLAPTYKRAPVVFVRGEGVHLIDAEGNKYLDFLAGIAVNVLGYNDPDILAAIDTQSRRLLHVSNLFHTVPHALLARDLCESSFADRIFFCNSGTEANEGALKFSRKKARAIQPEKTEIVAFSNAFHGRTMGALAVTANPRYREPFEPLAGGVKWAAFNDEASAREAIGKNTAAVIVEPVQGEGGIIPATPEFLRLLRALCDKFQAALIFDEVQCGLGRTGKLWAHEHFGVTPDIMTLAKPLGGGLPIGAVLMTQAVADALEAGDHGSTFAASPFVTYVARAVFSKIHDAEFMENVQRTGQHLKAALESLTGPVAEVRGLGMMWGVRLEASVTAADVVAACLKRGLVIGSAGDNTLRIVPPLVIEEHHVREAVDVIGQSLKAPVPA